MGLRSFLRGTIFLSHAVKHWRTVRLRRTHPYGIVPDVPNRLTLHTIGESTLHPQLPDMIRRAKEADLTVTLSTNGTTLDEERARALVEAGPDILNVSIDAADPEKFRRVREGIDPQAVYEGLQRLRSLRDHRRSQKIKQRNGFVAARDMWLSARPMEKRRSTGSALAID